MKNKILILTASLLLIAMFVTPTMAMNPKNPKKIQIEMIRSGPSPIPFNLRITPGNVAHGRDGGITWGDYNIIDIQNTVEAEKMSILGGTYEMTGKFEVNLKNPGTPVTTNFGPAILGKGHVILKAEIDFGSGNKFKGIMTTRGKIAVRETGPFAPYYVLYDGISRSVLQGTGDYKGWTIIWEREKIDGLPGYSYWDAYMLIP